MGLCLRGEHAHESTVIAARGMLITHDESEGITLGQSTDSRRGMELLQQVADTVAGRQGEAEVAPQMHEIGSTHSVRTLLSEVARELFKALGNMAGLPTTFDMETTSKLVFVLPIISLALPSIGSLMRWLRRYMIDQMNSDYVKFARSEGLSEGEIFSKHILKNAAIPIIHGIPGSVLGALTGAFITERVYVVPGIGGLLINAIGFYDNGVIVGVTLFYAILSVTSMILGDVLMAMVDPRINFTAKAR